MADPSLPSTQAVTPAPAPAQAPPATDTHSAADAAVKAGDTAAYRLAKRAERSGKPLDPVPVTAAPAAATEPAPVAEAEPPKPVAKPRDEEYISSRIREGVERGTAEIRSEVERLKQQIASHAPPKTEPEKVYDGTDPSDPKPDPNDFEINDEYLDARDEWNMRRWRRQDARSAQTAKSTQAREELTAAQQARVQTFATKLKEASAADPEFLSKLTPEVRALRPFAALTPGEPGGPDNIVAEQVFDSPIAPQVLRHFSEHPESLARLIAMPPEIQAMPQAVRTARHITWIVQEYGHLERTLSAPAPAAVTPAPAPAITNAPAPIATLGSRPAAPVDPKAAAVKSGNTSAYRALRRQERAAQLVRR